MKIFDHLNYGQLLYFNTNYMHIKELEELILDKIQFDTIKNIINEEYLYILTNVTNDNQSFLNAKKENEYVKKLI